MPGRLFSRVLAVSALAVLALLGGVPRADGSGAFDPRPYLHARRLVDVGGQRMNLYCIGSGAPAVVFDAGLGGGTLDWRLVQPAIARRTRACSFDRAGMRFSDAVASPRNATSAALDLHALLMRADVRPPYVLVAHSIAGLYARAYLDRFPHEVAGVVFVDPSTQDELERFDAIVPGYAAEQRRTVAILRACGRLATRGMLSRDGAARARCIGTPDPSLPHALQLRDAAFYERPGAWTDLASESANLATSAAQIRRGPQRYGALPLVVLTAGAKREDPALDAARRRAKSAAWKQMHDALARTSSRGTSIVVPGSDHYIALDRPRAVISAIDTVVAAARAPTR